MTKRKRKRAGVCRVCGCRQECACQQGCYWVETDLCSVCAERESPEGKAFVRGMAEILAGLAPADVDKIAVADLCGERDLNLAVFRNAAVPAATLALLVEAGVPRK